MRRRTVRTLTAASGAAAVAASAALVAAHTAVPAAAVPACRAAQLHFARPDVQPLGSVFVGYALTIRNVSSRACTLGHLLFVRVPRRTPATIEVQPELRSDAMPRIDLSHPLVLPPRKAAGTYVVVAAPCSGVHSSIDVPLLLGADAPPSAVVTTIRIRACRAAANRLDLPPLTNV